MRIILISLALMFSFVCQGSDLIAGFEDRDLTVLNEELRKLSENIEDHQEDLDGLDRAKVKASSTDSLAGYLDAKVKNSVEVDSDDLQLVNDEDTPGNYYSYMTNATGTKGWYNLLDTIPGWYPPSVSTDEETTGVDLYSIGGDQKTICSVTKTISSGNTVILYFSGEMVRSGVSLDQTIYLKQGATAEQTIKITLDDGVYTPISMCAVVTGLSGSTTFTVTGGLSSANSVTVKGNLVVLEIGGN